MRRRRTSWKHEAGHVRGAIHRVRNRQLAAAFETWQAAVGLEADGFTLKRAIMKLTHAKLSAAFRAWRVTAEQMKRAAHTTNGAIKRMLNRKLSAAFEAWQATAAQMATEAAAMHRAIKKMTNAKLAAAFETWRDLAMWSSALELRASQSCYRIIDKAQLTSSAENKD